MTYACEACRKRFRTESALRMHNRALHKDRVMPLKAKRAMWSYFRMLPAKRPPHPLLIGCAVLALAVGLYCSTYDVNIKPTAGQTVKRR